MRFRAAAPEARRVGTRLLWIKREGAQNRLYKSNQVFLLCENMLNVNK